MSKYGSGISMKAMLEAEMDEIRYAMKDLPKINQEIVAEAYKALAFQFCQSNAFACFMEDIIKQIMTEEQYNRFVKLMMHNATGYTTEKMLETYPWYADGFEEAEGGVDNEQ